MLVSTRQPWNQALKGRDALRKPPHSLFLLPGTFLCISGFSTKLECYCHFTIWEQWSFFTFCLFSSCNKYRSKSKGIVKTTLCEILITKQSKPNCSFHVFWLLNVCKPEMDTVLWMKLKLISCYAYTWNISVS